MKKKEKRVFSGFGALALGRIRFVWSVVQWSNFFTANKKLPFRS